MRRLPCVRCAYLSPVAGLLVGCAVAAIAVILGGTAVAQQSPAGARAVFEATHLPPLLTLPGEEVRLTYDVHCGTDGVEDPERSCDVRGNVLLREGARGPFRLLPLVRTAADGLRQLAAVVPPEITSSRDGFGYYAELESSGSDERLVVPAAGAEAPDQSLPLLSPVDVSLGTHSFGSTRRSVRVAASRWGDGATEVSLESGRNLPAIGASAFDVSEDGTILLLDQAHRRVLRWDRGSANPASVPLSIDGHLADMAVDENGSIYVLESVGRPGHAPVVRRFDDNGRELDVVETAERTPSQIRIGPDGPVVLQQPSHQWMPVAAGGTPTEPRDQRRGARVGRPLRSDDEVVVLRRRNEILAGIVAKDRVLRSWRIQSDTALAEVQLAEPVGRRLVLVVRIYSDNADEFVALVLDQRGVVQRFAIPSAEWAEAAPLGRFRLARGFLYQLGSNATGAFVDRYDLEVH